MIRAYIADRPFAGMGVGIAIVDHPGETSMDRQAQVLRLGEGSLSQSWEPVEDGANLQPTMTLDDSVARALLEGLNRHYGGVDDTRLLRKDYDAERKRVDKLIDVVSGIAEAAGSD